MKTYPALIIRPTLALLQVAGYVHEDRTYYRCGEARSYDHPDQYRGPVAIFASRSGRVEQGLPDRHFPKTEDCAAVDKAAKPWRYRLVGFVELLRVLKPSDKGYLTVFRKSWNLDHNDSLFYETRPIAGTLTDPDRAPLFTEVCTECVRLTAKSFKFTKDRFVELQNHQVSSHVRWQRVELPERFCP